MSLPDDVDDEEDYADGAPAPRASLDKAHWCRTCHSEVRYDSLGQGKVFRVKVYASNGLMRAGAWEACWKEMERVDVELEPIVDAALQDELVHVSAEQERALEMERALADEHREASETEYDEDDGEDEVEETEVAGPDEQPDEDDESFLEQAQDPELEHELCSSPPRPDEAPPNSSPAPMEDHRAEHEEERLREIYGRSPQPRRENTRDHESDFVAHDMTPSPPSAESSSRRQDRQQQAYKTASFPELVLEAGKVLLQDKKNVMIALLSALILMLAVRGARPAYDPAAFQPVMPRHNAHAMPHHPQDPVAEAAMHQKTATMATAAPSPSPSSQSAAAAVDPCASSLEVVANHRAARDGAGDASTSTLRVFETWRIVETVTETAKETLTQTETVSVNVVGGGPAAALETDALARWGA
ncbi:translation initiation factor eIF2B [Hirsutella rhossiliensis]|uniref:Translation initiation factor eIF2B n=1 Tax=Hirsutella rhossiliensis TaxID=111463 RepID=A0A9P8SKE2_9HYPO|nr:translation initiation factor eIF2B [Hirsutella rhossiliensis]KAH0966273.1 translation initiation factor eIF2B [Hirsutella rhossiliensis]